MRFAALFSTLLLALPAQAADQWLAVKTNAAGLPRTIVAQRMAPAPSGIRHMLTATGFRGSDIPRAWYAEPTNRYRHGALGDTIEGGALVVVARDGTQLTHRLSQNEVFEDLHPRIADLDGDGSAEIITIRASLSAGAAVTIYGLKDGALVEKASTPFIGRSFRWLNIAGIAPFAGPGQQIAIVITPHIGGTLAFLQYRNGRLTTIARARGFSNHVNRTTELRLSAVADVDGDGRAELAVPTDDRRRLVIVGLKGGRIAEIGSAQLPASIDKAIAVSGRGPSTVFTVGLENGDVYKVRRP